MYPRQSLNLRYLTAARKAALKRSLAVGAIVVLPAACGGSKDADVFLATTTAVPATAPAGTAAPATVAPATVAPATAAPATAAPTTAVAATPVTTAAPASAGTSETVIDFTYQVSGGGGRARNPYIAVWVEDASGALVQTVSLWHKDGRDKWLHELSTWYNAAGDGQGTAETTGATRAAGTYTVVWDGLAADGTAVPAGEYTLWVESAREHGPHSITSTPITVGSGAATVTAPDNGELSGINVTINA